MYQNNKLKFSKENNAELTGFACLIVILDVPLHYDFFWAILIIINNNTNENGSEVK